jgi:hypothetical protein
MLRLLLLLLLLLPLLRVCLIGHAVRTQQLQRTYIPRLSCCCCCWRMRAAVFCCCIT